MLNFFLKKVLKRPTASEYKKILRQKLQHSLRNFKKILTFFNLWVPPIKKVKGVLKKPEPTVVVNKLGEHGVELLVRIWVDKPGFEQKYFFLLTETCKEALDGAGITIPYPHHNIHIVKEGKLRKAKKK